MRATLYRYKIFMLFIVLCFVTTPNAFISLLSVPVRCLLTLKPHILPFMLSLGGFISSNIVWHYLQKSMVANDDIENFFLTLPITAWQKRLHEIIIILMTQWLLWLPLGMAIINIQGAMPAALVVLTLTLTCHILIDRQRYWLTTLLGFTVGLILFIANSSAGSASAVCVFIAIGLNGAGLLVNHQQKLPERERLYPPLNVRAKTFKLQLFDKTFLSIYLQCRNLLLYKFSLLFSALGLAISFFISDLCMIHTAQNISPRQIFKALMLINALLCSNLYVRLHQLKKPYTIFLTLPISARQYFIEDFLIAVCLLLMIMSLEGMVFYLNGIYFSMRVWLKIGMYATLFLAILRPLQLSFKKYGFLLGLIVMIFFTALQTLGE